MDTTILVENFYAEGKKLIQALDGKGYVYPIAFWMKENGDSDWTLVFGVPDIKTTGSKDILKKIHALILKNQIDISLGNISVVDTTSGICQMIKKSIKTGKGISKISFTGNIINGVRFPDSIIYRVI